MSNGDDATAGPSGSQDLQSEPIVESILATSLGEGTITLYEIPESECDLPLTPVKTPVEASKKGFFRRFFQEACTSVHKPRTPLKTSTPEKKEFPSSSKASRKRGIASPQDSILQETPKKTRRSLNFSNSDSLNMIDDSGSEGEEDDENCNEEENDFINFFDMRRHTRKLRYELVQEQGDGRVLCDGEYEIVNVNEYEIVRDNDNLDEVTIENDGGILCEGEYEVNNSCDLDVNESIENKNVTGESDLNESGRCGRKVSTAAAPADTQFCWSEDFTTFTGQRETYSRESGPTFSSHDPADIFCKIWDPKFMEMIVGETNKYAWDKIAQFSDPDNNTKIPDYLEAWTEITVEELYRYFAVLILISFCHRSSLSEYWDKGVMGMPAFRQIMSRTRFFLINKFLHFVPNEKLFNTGHQRKIEKVAPVLDHCNRKFAELYIPSQYLSLDESLLLWKGRLSWKQCIRTKAARFGIKSFELCEATTGYLLQYRLYTGKRAEMHPEPLHGFQNNTAKIVLNLMEGYLDVGHVLVMDNWYNQLLLTRYLKTRRTDVLGTVNRRQNGIPTAIKELIQKNMKPGSVVSRHCGDIALVAWRDVKLVTTISSYHRHEMIKSARAGQLHMKPSSIMDYNKYMGGVDLKDQKLSMYLMERKRNQKWYMKVFRRLFNCSLLNAFIIYTRNPMCQVHTHRSFRKTVALDLLKRYPRIGPIRALSQPKKAKKSFLNADIRLKPGNHFPVHTEANIGPEKMRHRQMRCVRCTAQKRRVCVTVKCMLCNVPLCIGKCWQDYHSVVDLKKSVTQNLPSTNPIDRTHVILENL